MMCTIQMRPPGLEFIEHGIDVGFYYIDMGKALLLVPNQLVVITVIPDQVPLLLVEVTVDVIHAELCRLASSSFSWRVKEISPSEFAVAFPFMDILRPALGETQSLYPSTRSWSLSSHPWWTLR